MSKDRGHDFRKMAGLQRVNYILDHLANGANPAEIAPAYDEKFNTAARLGEESVSAVVEVLKEISCVSGISRSVPGSQDDHLGRDLTVWVTSDGSTVLPTDRVYVEVKTSQRRRRDFLHGKYARRHGLDPQAPNFREQLEYHLNADKLIVLAAEVGPEAIELEFLAGFESICQFLNNRRENRRR